MKSGEWLAPDCQECLATCLAGHCGWPKAPSSRLCSSEARHAHQPTACSSLSSHWPHLAHFCRGSGHPAHSTATAGHVVRMCAGCDNILQARQASDGLLDCLKLFNSKLLSWGGNTLFRRKWAFSRLVYGNCQTSHGDLGLLYLLIVHMALSIQITVEVAGAAGCIHC